MIVECEGRVSDFFKGQILIFWKLRIKCKIAKEGSNKPREEVMDVSRQLKEVDTNILVMEACPASWSEQVTPEILLTSDKLVCGRKWNR